VALSIEIKGLEKLNRLAKGMPMLKVGIKGKVAQASFDFANRLIRAAKMNVTQGGENNLKVRTGKLRASINANVAEEGDSYKVTLGANTVYARIHEYGGVTRPHIIAPKRGGALAFMFGGKLTFARYVRHPGSWIKARPYLQPAVDQEMPKLQRALAVLLKDTADEAFKAA
jgi:phage gpG-like protein